MGDKQLPSVTLLLTQAELHWVEGGAEQARVTQMKEMERWRKRESKKDEIEKEIEKE